MLKPVCNFHLVPQCPFTRFFYAYASCEAVAKNVLPLKCGVTTMNLKLYFVCATTFFFILNIPMPTQTANTLPKKDSFAVYTLVMLKEIVLKLIIFALNERRESLQDLKTCSPASMSIINIKFVSFSHHKNLALKQE